MIPGLNYTQGSSLEVKPVDRNYANDATCECGLLVLFSACMTGDKHLAFVCL